MTLPHRVDVSVVVLVLDAPRDLVQLYQESADVLAQAGHQYEFLFAVPPEHRAAVEALAPLVARGAPIRVLEYGRTVSESAMLRVAAAHARAPVLITLPGFRQAEFRVLPELIERVKAGADLAVAWRYPRRDSLVNRWRSTVLHALVGGLAGGRLHDVASGVRAMRTGLLNDLRLYGELARFLPLVARKEGFIVEEVATPIHPDAMARRRFSLGTYVRRLIDIGGIIFLFRFTDRPLRFFGLVGVLMSAVGATILLALLLVRLNGSHIAGRPFLLLGVLVFVVGIQSIAFGLVGEMIVHLNAGRRVAYRFRDEPVSPPTFPDRRVRPMLVRRDGLRHDASA